MTTYKHKRQLAIEIPEPPNVPTHLRCQALVRKSQCRRPAVDGGKGFCARHAAWNDTKKAAQNIGALRGDY